MKIAEILAESLATRKIPFEVDYDYEWDDPNRDENLDPFETITFSGYVTVTPMAYSVHGSPTEYEVHIENVTDSTGRPFDQNQLNNYVLNQIHQQAIDQVAE